MLLHNKFEIRSLIDSIILVNVFSDAEIEVEDIKELHAMILPLTKGEQYLLLVNAGDPISMSAEARALIAGEEFAAARIAIAFVTRAMANILLGNFFIKINRPLTPTKIFSTQEAAIKWLQQQKADLSNP